MITKSHFEEGQRVLSPKGEGEVLSVNGNEITVRLNSGEEAVFVADLLSDDSAS